MSDKERVALHDALCQKVVDFLASRGIFAFLTNGYGAGDVLACAQGRFLSIEVKTGHKKLTSAQSRFRQNTLRSGGLYLLAQSVEDVQFFVCREGLLSEEVIEEE